MKIDEIKILTGECRRLGLNTALEIKNYMKKAKEDGQVLPPVFNYVFKKVENDANNI